MVYQTEKTLSEMGDKIARGREERASRLSIDKLKEALKGDRYRCHQGCRPRSLHEEVLRRSAEKLYQQQRSAQGRPDMGGAQGAGAQARPEQGDFVRR